MRVSAINDSEGGAPQRAHLAHKEILTDIVAGVAIFDSYVRAVGRSRFDLRYTRNYTNMHTFSGLRIVITENHIIII